MIFNTFNQDKQKVVVSTETPYICQMHIKEKNKNCQNFYKNICADEKKQEVFVCPYGLCTYKTENAIYTCLNISGKADLTKIVPNFKRYKQDVRQFTQYSLSQIVKIVAEFEKMNHEVQVRRLTIHDIKNATKHFIDLVEDVKNDEEVIKIAEANDKLFSSVEGYNLIQYRLAYHDKLLNYEEYNVEVAYINFHQAIKKLSKLLMYRGMKKDVQIKFKGVCRRSFNANKDLYLMYFILLENALKFSLEHTEVDVIFSFTEEQELKIEISNECHTIALGEIDYIFSSGFRSESAVNSTKGSGLGLTLAKRIANISNVQLECIYEAISDKTGKFIMECIHKR